MSEQERDIARNWFKRNHCSFSSHGFGGKQRVVPDISTYVKKHLSRLEQSCNTSCLFRLNATQMHRDSACLPRCRSEDE